MALKKLFGKLHLWLGLTTGLVVVIIGLTGAIYCFAPELQNLQSYRWVKEENSPFLKPSQIKAITENKLPGKKIQRIYYDAKDKSVMVLLSEKDSYNYSLFVNPYNGKVLKLKNNKKDFLNVVIELHRTLLIPYGKEVIRWSTVVFIFMLISGIVLWWPKNNRTAKHGFKIKWTASPKRLNYDLHKVMGFYISWFAIIIALTGLMFAFESFADLVYKTTGAANSIIQKKPPLSDTTIIPNNTTPAIDIVWTKMKPNLYKDYAAIMFVLPSAPSGSILVRANPETSTLYKTDFRYFDQYSGEEHSGAFVWGKYDDASTLSDNIRRMNYDIHTGAMFGLPGRILLFFLALIVASLPITGFMFWFWRKRKRRTQ